MSGLFGGSKQKSQSESKNLAYPFLQDTFGGAAGATGNVTSALSALFGLGGDQAGQAAAFNRFRDSTGYQAALKGAQEGVTSSNAARGLLASGDYGQRMAKTGADLATGTYQNYIANMLGLGQMGLGAGGLIANAGQTSKSMQESKSKPGLGGLLGAGLSMIPGVPG